MSVWEIISETARAILIMSITGSVIALLLFAIKPLIKNRIPKSVQYYLWVFVLIALFVPFSAFVSVPVSTPMASVREILATNIKTTAERQEELAQAKYNTPYEELDELKQIDISYREIGQVNRIFNDALLRIVAIGGVLVFLIEIAQYFIIVSKFRRWRLPVIENEASLLYQLYDGRKAPRLFRNPLAPAPMLIGIFRPAIYIPDTEYTEVQLRNILLHELTHLQRHDVVVKWLAALAVRLHWFNPIAYLVHREIDRACELACDEAVISNLNNDGKQAYGDTLIAVASEKKLPKTVLSTTMCEEKKVLKERLGAIMKSRKFSRKVIAVSCVLLIAVLCTIVVLGASEDKKSAVDVLSWEYQDEAAVVRPKSIIKQIDLDSKNCLIFYYNANGNIACAYMKKGFGSYSLIRSSAEQTVEGVNPVSAQFSAYDNGARWLVWGILRDESITRALVYDEEAVIIESDGLRLYYALGKGNPAHDDFQYYDNSDNLVWSISSVSEAAIYIWKDRDVNIFSLFMYGQNDYRLETEAAVYDNDMIFNNIDDLNESLEASSADFSHIYVIQMNISDYSKEEMGVIADQIKVSSDNYSLSIGAYADKSK